MVDGKAKAYIFMGLALFGLLIHGARPVRGADFETSSYTGILFFPATVQGRSLLNYDQVIGGVRFEFRDDRLGLEINLLTGLVAYEEYWDEIDFELYGDLPLIVTLGLSAYPIGGRVLAPYITAGVGGGLVELEFDDPMASELYGFWAFSAGTGLKCYLDEGERGVLFLESRRYILNNAEYFMQLRTFTIGYGLAF